MILRRFEEIDGWKLARQLTKEIYAVSKNQPFASDFGLCDQIRRASGSIMHNIAEGFDGGSNGEFIRFLRYAQRSSSEVQSQLYVALDQAYVEESEFNKLYELAGTAKGKVGGLIAYLLRNRKADVPGS